MKYVAWSLACVFGLAIVGCTIIADGSRVSAGCPDGTKECSGQCVSVDDVEFGCNRAGCSPCALPHSVAGCSAEGKCIIASCVGAWSDCDQAAPNGCEVNLDSSVSNCGECGYECEDPEGGEAACGEAQCYVRSCDPPWFDCNFDFRDGCEVDLDENVNHCGECDRVCEDDQQCTDGACRPEG